MKEKIPGLIKKYRKKRNLTQAGLAKDICTQAIISKIEKGEANPSVELFSKLCGRLKIPSNEIMTVLEVEEKSDFNSEEFVFSRELRRIYYKNDYRTLDYFLSKNIIKYEELSEINQIYYIWLESVVNFHYKSQKEKSLASLEALYAQLLKRQDKVKLFDRITQSLAAMYYEIEEYEKSLSLYNTILDSVLASESVEFKVSCLHNLSQLYIKLDDDAKALEYSSLEIDILVEEENLFNLGEAFLQLSQILYQKKLFNEAADNCQKAIHIFDILNNYLSKNTATSFLLKIQKELQ